jgi:hypothetical protein
MRRASPQPGETARQLPGSRGGGASGSPCFARSLRWTLRRFKFSRSAAANRSFRFLSSVSRSKFVGIDFFVGKEVGLIGRTFRTGKPDPTRNPIIGERDLDNDLA